VTPDTLLPLAPNLDRDAIRWESASWAGYPPVAAEIRTLVVQMAVANRDWSYTRIQGALVNLHHDVSLRTRAPEEAILEPGHRPPQTLREFLAQS
jgi:hypothetical protein